MGSPEYATESIAQAMKVTSIHAQASVATNPHTMNDDLLCDTQKVIKCSLIYAINYCVSSLGVTVSSPTKVCASSWFKWTGGVGLDWSSALDC